MAEFLIEAGTKVKDAEGVKYSLTEQVHAVGDVVPEPAVTQKTYMQKAQCPKCKRIIRVTLKNWGQTDVRAGIMCHHKDNEMFEFVLDNAPPE